MRDKYFIVIEGLAVLVGVLMAFAIEAWWQHENDREREKQYIGSIKDELLEVNQEIKKIQNLLDGRIQTKKDLLKIGVAGEEISTDSLNRLLSKNSPYIPFSHQKAALHDLLETGGMKYIQNDSLRRSLASYEQSLNNVDKLQESYFNYYLNFLDAHAFKYFNLEDLLSRSYFDIPDLPFETDPSGFVKNKYYANATIGLIWYERRLMRAYEILSKDVERILSLVGKEEGK